MEFRFDHIKIIITKTKKKIFRIVVTTIIIGIVIIIALSGLALANKNKLAHGLKIADVSIGSLTVDKAKIKIEEIVENFLKKDIILRYNNPNGQDIWTALPDELGIKIDIDSTIDKASKIGHQENIFLNLGQQILAFFGYYNLPLECEVNEMELENFIREKLNSIDNPAVNAGWQYDKKINNFVQIPSQKGIIIDREDFKFQLYKKVEKLAKDDVFLNLINDYPEILEDETKEAIIKAQEILENAPYTFVIKDPEKVAPEQIILTKEKMIPMIEFQQVEDKNNPINKILDATLEEQALKNYLIALSHSINRDPVNAQFTIEGDRVIEFSLSRNGLKLGIDNNISKIKEEILIKSNKEFELELWIISPKVATKNIDNLGITSLIGKGSSNFGGSPKNRVHNINVGASKFHGVLIKPGEEFSFNTSLGEVGPEQGYKPELVIKQDKTTPEYGGGLCQVSTTAFRAAVYSGLPIKERAPHAFPVVYYNPQGFDATIYPPHPDLRFINNTPGHILIQTKVEGNILTFEFYGTNDGHRVEVEGPYQYDIKSDGSMKAKLIRKIYDKDGNLVIESTFLSNYKSPSLYPVQRNPLE